MVGMSTPVRHTREVMRHLAFALLLAACGGSSKPASTTGPGSGSGSAVAAADDPSCPLLVPGTSISVEDTQAGPALVFVTTGDVAAVRTRAGALAAMHNQGNGPATAFGAIFKVKSTASVAEIEGGARVTFQPADPAGAGAVGDELRMHAQMLGAGSCEMRM